MMKARLVSKLLLAACLGASLASGSRCAVLPGIMAPENRSILNEAESATLPQRFRWLRTVRALYLDLYKYWLSVRLRSRRSAAARCGPLREAGRVPQRPRCHSRSCLLPVEPWMPMWRRVLVAVRDANESSGN